MEDKIILFIVVGIIAICVCILFVAMKNNKYNRSARGSLNCPAGRFSVYGVKKKFKIQKDNRFIFEVENGQIVSVKDKQASMKKVRY